MTDLNYEVRYNDRENGPFSVSFATRDEAREYAANVDGEVVNHADEAAEKQAQEDADKAQADADELAAFRANTSTADPGAAETVVTEAEVPEAAAKRGLLGRAK